MKPITRIHNESLGIGRLVEHYQQVGSTNDLVRAQAQAGAAEGLVVSADEQVAGRGRLGRGWQAPPATCVLMSALLRPTWLPPDAAFTITMLAAVALCEAVETVVPAVSAALKWPNDLLLPASPEPAAPRRKAAGILSELVMRDEQIDFIALGIGVNVNWSPSGVVDGRDLSISATSVAQAAGHQIERDVLFAALLDRLNARYATLRRGGRETIVAAWRSRLATIGQHVTITTATETLTGVIEDAEASGALRLRDAGGMLHRIMAGDVGG